MERAALISQLDRATSKAMMLAIQRCSPIPINRNRVVVGNICVDKNKSGFYDILTPDRKHLYKDVYLYEIAIILAQRYAAGDTSAIRKVLALQDRFEKHHLDMLHYLQCMKSAKKKHDIERMAILEDKFQISESFAKDIREKMSLFKRVK